MSARPNRKAQLLTGALIAAIAVWLWTRPRGAAPEPATEASAPTPVRREPSPQDAIYAMIDAARAGDVKTYLACFTGAMRPRLEQALAESGEAKFGDYLKRTNAELKGVAIDEPAAVGNGEVKARVEYVYAGRNEVQVMTVLRTGAGWKIARLDEAERVKTQVPYGTPVR
ncbi:MAG: hypothetical protein IT163_04970 [Bryobacterales bacterium]|nr:hypothetical protein [Bryobacterales bacterium]